MKPDSFDEPVPAELADVTPAELADTSPAERTQPPLSIGHLLLWILGSALVLASYRWVAEPEGLSTLFLVDQLLRSVTMGGGVVALAIYARRLVTRDAPLPRQPGHWLLVVQGLVWPAYWSALVWVYGLRGGEPAAGERESYYRYVIGMVLFYLYGAGVYVFVLAWLKDSPRWRMFLAVCAAGALLHAVIWCCVLSEPGLGSVERFAILARIFVTLPLIVLCVLRDRAERVPRDWLHAIGVAFYLAGSVTSLGVFLLQLAMPR